MGSTKQKPVRANEVRIGQTYYMPVPVHTITTNANCTTVSVADHQHDTGMVMVMSNADKLQASVTRSLLRDGTLMYRSKGKAKRQSKAGQWLRPWRERDSMKPHASFVTVK
jgi:uncharacterized membrane protein